MDVREGEGLEGGEVEQDRCNGRTAGRPDLIFAAEEKEHGRAPRYAQHKCDDMRLSG